MGCVAPRSSDAAMASAAGDSSAMVVRVEDIAPPFFEEAESLSATATDFDPSVEGSASTSSSALSAPTYAGIRPPAPPPAPVSIEPLPPETRSMDTHVIRPLVIVPVLSSATVPHSANASKVTPPRTSTPRRAHAPIAATYTSGAISSAHGAAADRNANALYIAPPRPRNGQPKTKGPTTIVNAVTARIALEYVSPTRSSIIVTAGRRFCAASVRRAMRAGVLSSEDRMDFTTNAPSELTAPAGTSSPTRFKTGNASPVMC